MLLNVRLTDLFVFWFGLVWFGWLVGWLVGLVVCLFVCVPVCARAHAYMCFFVFWRQNSSLVGMDRITDVYIDMVFGFYGYLF